MSLLKKYQLISSYKAGSSNEKPEKASYLYNLLRPEFVRVYEKPLSSDAFVSFGKHNADVHNAEVKEATKYLKDTLVPAFSRKLDANEEIFPFQSFTMFNNRYKYMTWVNAQVARNLEHKYLFFLVLL